MYSIALLFAAFFCALPVAANEFNANSAEDVWESAQLEGNRIGFVHTRFERIRAAGSCRLRATQTLELTIRRRNVPMQLRMEFGTEESPEGKVLGVFMRQFHGQGRQLVLNGKLEGGRMHVVVDNGRIERRLWWSDDVVGLHGQERIFRGRELRPGQTFEFLAYESTVNTVVKRQVRMLSQETVSVATGRQLLLRIEAVPEKLQAGGTTVQLSPTVFWVDGGGIIKRRQIELEGLGTIDLIRTDRRPEQISPDNAASTPDIGLRTLTPLNHAISSPLRRLSATYRVTVRGEADAAAAFITDAHQETRASRGDTCELIVHPLREPRGQGAAQPGAEFLGFSYYVDCDDERIRSLARRAVGVETDPWQAAVRIERWVHHNLRPDQTAPFVPASQVARTLRGDCRHYALLTTAMCRVEGIPARTAVGLVQVERNGRPYLGFHLWTEVCVDGHWRGLDGTLGQGGVGVAHLKVADHSWSNTRSLTPFLPAQRLLGKLSVAVQSP